MIDLPPSLTEREQIERLAYYLYEDEGRPDGRAAAHWARAKEFIQSQRLAIAASAEKPQADGDLSTLEKTTAALLTLRQPIGSRLVDILGKSS
jgi:Protein of unknown function (DUF2934)